MIPHAFAVQALNVPRLETPTDIVARTSGVFDFVRKPASAIERAILGALVQWSPAMDRMN